MRAKLEKELENHEHAKRKLERRKGREKRYEMKLDLGNDIRGSGTEEIKQRTSWERRRWKILEEEMRGNDYCNPDPLTPTGEADRSPML